MESIVEYVTSPREEGLKKPSKELTVIRDSQMEQFMDDHRLADGSRFSQEL